MEDKQVNLFYEEMKNTFVKPSSDWVDKAKTFRTLLEKFFQNLTPEMDSQATLWERMVAYYDANPDEDAMKSRVHRIRKKLNDIVHDELEIGPEDVKHVVVTKEEIRKIYEDFVLVVYNSTKVFPDGATFELLGINQSDCLKGLNEQQKDAVLTDSRIVFVNAGPGTGKTTLLVQKMVHHIIKNPQSNHTISIGDTLVKALKQYKNEQEEYKQFYGDAYLKHYEKKILNEYTKREEIKIVDAKAELDINLPEAELVFVKPNGQFRGTETVRHAFKVINYELGIKCRFHDFRDTHTTRLIEQGADIKAVSKRLGHSTIQTTYNIYVRVTSKMESDTVDRFENYTNSLNIPRTKENDFFD